MNPTCAIITPPLITPAAAHALVAASFPGLDLPCPAEGEAFSWTLPLGYELTHSVAPWGAEIWQARRGDRRPCTRSLRNMQDLDTLLLSIRAELRRSSREAA